METLEISRADLLDRLHGHRMLGDLPDAELEWLVAHGHFVRMPAGETVSYHDGRVQGVYFMTKGQIAILVEKGGAKRRTMEWNAGDVTGYLPFSRMVSPPGDTIVILETEALLIPREDFPELIRECPALIAILVHVMVDRARAFVTSDLHDEKLVSLGKLAAGLAHELNNPASAAVRAAEQLQQGLIQSDDAARALGRVGLTDEQMAAVLRVREACLMNRDRTSTPIERADREDAISDWLDHHGADSEAAAPLADTTVSLPTLDMLADAVPSGALDAALRWIAAGCTARALAMDIERAASRMYELVRAVKGFTYMDRSTVPEPVDVRVGLRDTITVLAHKAKQKSVAVRLEAAPDLQPVNGFGGELNQVWSNLIDNALDAVEPGGEVVVHAERDPAGVIVRVVDNGSGIPPDVLPRIFEPFFTTKPVGQGTGLGLDIVQRLLRKHAAEVTVDSRPGHTEFRVIIPVR